MIDTATTPLSLTERLRRRTRLLHARAEKSGIVAELLRGRVEVTAYGLFLRQLAPAYEQLETGLERHRLTPGVDVFARPELYRSAALETDLASLGGPLWRQTWPLLPAAERYAHAVADAANGSVARLIGHAYVRYLGDLSGGQVLKRLLANTLGLRPHSLSFYEFRGIGDVDAYKRSLRDRLDRARLSRVSRSEAVDAAVEAFALNIDVSDAVWTAVVEYDPKAVQAAPADRSGRNRKSQPL